MKFFQSNFDFLKKHFEETPQEELDKEWKEIEPLNDIGPDVLEYTDKIKMDSYEKTKKD
ncbi:MAG: hypothetical protein ACI3YI_10015 [Bacteroidaceae bacterium]